MMKITLVRPVFNMEELRPIVDVPLGLLSLATILHSAGHTVKIIDLQMLLVKGILTFTDDYYYRCGQVILRDAPEMIGFTALCNSYPEALLIAKECRGLAPLVPIIFGGPQATFVDVDTLQEFPWVDAIVRGEGERVILKLVRVIEEQSMHNFKPDTRCQQVNTITLELAATNLEEGVSNLQLPMKKQEHRTSISGKVLLALNSVPGVTYRAQDGRIVRNADEEYISNLDTLPLLNYDLVDFGEEYFKADMAVPLDVGRGCPYNCRYCSTSLLWRRQFRIKSPERIVAEIKDLHQRFGVKIFKLTHDLFTVNKEIAIQFARLLKETCPEVSWSCSARTTTMDEEILEEFSTSKCQMIFYGIESGSRETLKYFKKNLDPTEALEVVRKTLQKKIKVMTSFIVGAPEENEESVNQTLRLGLQCKVLGATSAHIHVLIPESGTEIYLENRDKLELNLDALEDSMRLANAKAQAELEMIKQYPQIFSTFYTIQNPRLPAHVLHEIEATYNRVMHSFARTVFVMLREKGWQPLTLLQEWKKWWMARETRKTSDASGTSEVSGRGFTLKRTEVIQSFPTYVRDLVQSGLLSTPYLLDLLKYEETSVNLDDARYFPDRTPCTVKAGANDYVTLSCECAAEHFHYNLPRVIQTLQQFELPTQVEAEENYLIFKYLGANSVKSIITNAFTYDILDNCREKIRRKDLKELIIAKWAKMSATVETDFDNALDQLTYHHFIITQASN